MGLNPWYFSLILGVMSRASKIQGNFVYQTVSALTFVPLKKSKKWATKLWDVTWTLSGRKLVWHSIAGLQVTSRRPCWWSITKAFLSAGKWTLFWCKFSRKNYFVLTTNMAALSRGCKPRIAQKKKKGFIYNLMFTCMQKCLHNFHRFVSF